MRKYKNLIEAPIGTYFYINSTNTIPMMPVQGPRIVENIYSWMEPRTRNHRMVARLYRRKFLLYNGEMGGKVTLVYGRVPSKARFRYKHVYM